jgi:hypothetical protein
MMMNNPQKTRKVQGIINDIHLLFNSSCGTTYTYIIVEGSDDLAIYQKFFKNENVKFYNSNGKLRLIDVLTGISEKIKPRSIGICDADFSHLDNDYPPATNIFFTDYHDIEMTMLKFDGIFYDSISKFRSQLYAEKVLSDLLRETSYLAYIRWYNHKNQFNLRFKCLDFKNIFLIQDGTIAHDMIKLIEMLNYHSISKIRTLTSEDIYAFITENKTNDYFNLCNGHDITMLIVILLEGLVGQNISREKYRDSLYASFRLDHFIQTKLYKEILAWQTANGFDILKTMNEDANG